MFIITDKKNEIVLFNRFYECKRDAENAFKNLLLITESREIERFKIEKVKLIPAK